MIFILTLALAQGRKTRPRWGCARLGLTLDCGNGLVREHFITPCSIQQHFSFTECVYNFITVVNREYLPVSSASKSSRPCCQEKRRLRHQRAQNFSMGVSSLVRDTAVSQESEVEGCQKHPAGEDGQLNKLS